MGVLEDAIAGFVREFPAGQIPPEVVAHAKRCIVNFSGVALNGSTDSSPDILMGLFEEERCRGSATVIGRGERVTGTQAALMNGYLGHLDDFDDTHMGSHIHPTSPILPALLAVAEQRPISGADLVAAFVIGVEIACRVGRFVQSHGIDRASYLHPTETYGVLGAAAGAGRLLGLDQEQMVYTMAIAATQAAGLRVSSGSMCKPLHAGKSAQTGLWSAQLASRGFTGSSKMFIRSRLPGS